MKFVWVLGTYKYFQAFPVVLKKRFALLFQNVFMCALTNQANSFAYYLKIINFTEIRASF